jgi:putative endonuclease
MNRYYVYILASNRNGTLYVGVTNDLVKRVYEHKKDVVDGFTKKYHVHTLVYYEDCGDSLGAITREKQIKKWKKNGSLNLLRR